MKCKQNTMIYDMCEGQCYVPSVLVPSVLWHCWLGGRKGIRPVKTEWWGAGMVICLERGADLYIAQLMPLPLTVSCFSKIQIGFTFLVPAHLVVPEKGPLNGCVCVCVKASAKRLKESCCKRWHLSMMKTEKLIKAATEKELIEVSSSYQYLVCMCSLPWYSVYGNSKTFAWRSLNKLLGVLYCMQNFIIR